MYPNHVEVLFAILALAAAAAAAEANESVRINEVADKGSSSTCSGEDWIELHLPATSTASSVDMTGYTLHDDKGTDDADAFTFPEGGDPVVLNRGEYLLLCAGGSDPLISPQFGIGGTDQVTLLDPSGALVSTTGPLQDRGEFDVSFAHDESSEEFVYTSTPTPGEENEITPLPEPETVEEMRARLIAQNDMGTAFFNMDADGKPLTEGEGYDDIVDLRMEMDPAVWEQMYQDRSYEVYSRFLSATVTEYDNPDALLLNMTSAGRLRPKGQSTLSFGTCLDRTVPYSIDFDTTNPDQTLFGVERAYLRTHLGDSAFAREWSQHRMLARFGLPHLRTRTVRFFVNDELVGLYDLLEAPDQDYVFQRSFPTFDPSNYALFKVKTLSLGCGTYDSNALERAEARMDDAETPPYAFERGEHRDKVPVLKDWTACINVFGGGIAKEFDDVVLAYARGGGDCGSVLVSEGLVDRDLGVTALEDMESFINKHLGSNGCEDSTCANSDLADDVDVDNFLRNYAVQAALLNSDSPLGNGNNYYLGKYDANSGWAMVQYDHNGIISSASADLCDAGQCYDDLVKWSILRPTCRALEYNQMAGPLLTNDSLRAQYVEYVRQFVNEVMTDDALLDQIYNHFLVIKDEAMKNDWNDFASLFEQFELSQDDTWLLDLPAFDTKYIAFLPALRVRSEEIKKQLAAIDEGTFPRPMDDIGAGEVCVNWEATEARMPICPEDCLYAECYRPDFDVPAFCSPDNGMCYHGVIDAECGGVGNGMQYLGMEAFESSDKAPFCWQDPTLGPLKLGECPTYAEANDDDDSSGGDGYTTMRLRLLMHVFACIVAAVCSFFV
mmetsp:Transcript_37688/g.82134  ORF Transcript_37688/g.82134 Transcript_37688/m.82134 type:complete len:838 (-) Transcript_37688:126-2639(-)|eukprot:CAMPEP_0178612672 /NCGR_PEP_ID=MMETSP0698-20121128/1247_1 /TAXON_ID=265572 /ORGANISM="Extubocellulus spinifer, Strain CCMP396" /LENGTH=837 /DNA_ID=CAMNT_0020251339 /DNA_START=92 /DNA_END=2605 /DNA_ORIENTATION=+